MEFQYRSLFHMRVTGRHAIEIYFQKQMLCLLTDPKKYWGVSGNKKQFFFALWLIYCQTKTDRNFNLYTQHPFWLLHLFTTPITLKILVFTIECSCQVFERMETQTCHGCLWWHCALLWTAEIIFSHSGILYLFPDMLAVLYPGQNFWRPSLAPSNIFRGPFWIFEGHELMEENITKNELTIKFCFEHGKAQSFPLKIKMFSFCVEEQLYMSISMFDRTSPFFGKK